MKKRSLTYALLGVVAVTAAGGLLASRSFLATETTVQILAGETHFHGIAVDAQDTSKIYLATHHGFFEVSLDGVATRLSRNTDDFMGFTPHPTDPTVLYASGHPMEGGNLGIIISTDGGRTWRQLAEGVEGPVDFHQMDVSKAEPSTIYGVYGDLQVSSDGGRKWSIAGAVPEGLIDLAASATDVNSLYAASESGLAISKDGGKSWRAAFALRRPATMVTTTANGEVYAFVVGTGLIRTKESSLNWGVLSNGFGDGYVLHLAVDPADDRNLYAVIRQPQTRSIAILVSRDAGRTWSPLGSKTTE